MLAPLMTVIQLTLLVDVQGQFDPVVTAMVPGVVLGVPVEGTDTVVGDTL